MRRRQLKRLWAQLKQLSSMALSREELLMKLGAARDQSRTAWRLVTLEIAAEDATFSYRLDRNKLRQTRLREGRYLIRCAVECATITYDQLKTGTMLGGANRVRRPPAPVAQPALTR
jgi:hypothetical protein